MPESSTRDGNGIAFSFTCNVIGNEGELFVELCGKPISGGHVNFYIDGETFSMTTRAEDGRINTECSACGDNHTAPWQPTSASSLMAVRASDGQSVTSGSSEALGDEACRPHDGY